jgi:arsenite methyltransferase
MGARGRVEARIARQLGHPSGLVGRLISKGLNRGNRRLIERAVQALPSGPDAVVADVGFGGGVGLRLLLDRPDAFTVHGIEVSTEMINQARAAFAADITAGRLHLHHASITALPLGTSSLDGIITVNTIYFVDDLDQAFSELARTLAGSGRAVIGIGDPDAMGKLSFTSHGFRLRPVVDIQAALGRAGLTLDEHVELGEGRIPAHLLVSTLDSTHRASAGADSSAGPAG